MATIINDRSSLATDPIRNFRFLVTFKPHQASLGAATGANNASANNAGAMKDITYGFTAVSGLAVTTDSIPYREGGYNTTFHQIPGQTSFSPLTMSRGVQVGTRNGWDWMRQLFQTVQGTGGSLDTVGNFRCDVEIKVLSHPIPGSGAGNDEGASGTSNDHVALRFNVYNAWITAIAYSDLNAGDNAILVEQMSLVHEGFDVIWGKDLTKAGSAESIDPGF
jgi:phage tail-like protein